MQKRQRERESGRRLESRKTRPRAPRRARRRFPLGERDGRSNKLAEDHNWIQKNVMFVKEKS